MASRGTSLLEIALLVSTILQATSALNILVIATVQTRSHYTFGDSMTNLLLEKGHHVYELTTLPPAKPHPNRTSFVVENALEGIEMDLSEISLQSNTHSIMFLVDWAVSTCKKVLDSQAGRDLLALARDTEKRPRIDVVVHDYIFQQCLGPFASEFGAPNVAMTAYGNAVEMDELMGGPVFPGFIPHDIVIHPFDQPLGWLKRLENKWAYLVSYYGRNYIQYPQMDAHSKAFFGENSPTIEEVRKKLSVALVNSHPAIQGSRPQLPAVVQVGGFHVPPIRELPAGKMKDFLDGAKHGFILLSFGSIVPVSKMEPWRRKALLQAFKRLSPLRIIMKWEVPWNEAQDGPLPDNVFLSPWIPQSDVQGHPNIRLFVTHCGGLSTNEVIARALPIIAVPFFVDQYINANKLIAMKAGIMLPYNEITEETFYNAVRAVLDDKQYVTAVRRLSSFYHDQPESPQERAVFWVEFVARHKSAPHLRSPGELMSWATRWMIDDLILVTTLIIILVLVIRRTCAALCSKTNKTKTKSKKA